MPFSFFVTLAVAAAAFMAVSRGDRPDEAVGVPGVEAPPPDTAVSDVPPGAGGASRASGPPGRGIRSGRLGAAGVDARLQLPLSSLRPRAAASFPGSSSSAFR